MAYQICAVRDCDSDSLKRPELCYFSLPKIKSVKQEWLEKLGTLVSQTQFPYVCELHFRVKDFRIGARKELKSHAVPVLRLGRGSTDIIDSDDEFMVQDSEIESKTEQPKLVKTIKEEPLSDEEISYKLSPSENCNSGRRPSRRAAIVAAQKIRNCTPPVAEEPASQTLEKAANQVCEKPIRIEKVGSIIKTTVVKAPLKVYSPTVLQSPSLLPPPPPPVVTPAPSVDISLEMECYEEALSETQTEILSEAQNQYNLVMKGLKDLVQCSGKMVQTDASGTMVLNTLPFPSQTAPTIPSALPPLQPNTLFIKGDNQKLFPLPLAANTKPSYIFM